MRRSAELTQTSQVYRSFLSARRVSVTLALFLATTLAAGADAAGTAELCDSAAVRAAAETGVPAEVLLAITRTETGRSKAGSVRPWPWTVNMEGAGHWFDSRKAALGYAARHHARGARSFDVGCFQLNYRWHGHAFTSIDQMFEPLAGARYAARFLSELKTETGDWLAAAAAYHSRTPALAARYRARFVRHLDALRDGSAVDHAGDARQSDTAGPRENGFPLLRPGPRGPLGSLVPALVAGPPLLAWPGG